MTPLEVGDRAAADVTLWTRPHVGGLVDFEVISTDYSQRFWRHLEGPSADDVERAWHAMIEAYLAAESTVAAD